MKTVHLDPAEPDRASLVVEEIDRLLGKGKAHRRDRRRGARLLSPHHAADQLGFSRQHIVRLINAGELEAQKLPGSSYWQIPLGTALAFEERREHAREQSDAFSRSLDALGAPLE
jgi:excisionase family DNA binding protein